MQEFNVNGYCSIQLTDVGRQELKRQHDELNKYLNGKLGEYTPVKEDEDGWSVWQLHSLMNTFGHMLVVGADLPFLTTIRVDIKK